MTKPTLVEVSAEVAARLIGSPRDYFVFAPLGFVQAATYALDPSHKSSFRVYTDRIVYGDGWTVSLKAEDYA
jgi:hypothetical protein